MARAGRKRKTKVTVAPSHATPERLRHAGGHVETAPGTLVGEAKGQHIERLVDSPIDRLHRAGKITDEMKAAATRFYEDWYRGGLSPFKSSHSDLMAVHGAFGGRSPLPASEAAAYALQRHRQALAAITLAARPYVCGVVLEELSTTTVGIAHSEIKSEKQAGTAALIHLRYGLQDLVSHYGISTR